MAPNLNNITLENLSLVRCAYVSFQTKDFSHQCEAHCYSNSATLMQSVYGNARQSLWRGSAQINLFPTWILNAAVSFTNANKLLQSFYQFQSACQRFSFVFGPTTRCHYGQNILVSVSDDQNNFVVISQTSSATSSSQRQMQPNRRISRTAAFCLRFSF